MNWPWLANKCNLLNMHLQMKFRSCTFLKTDTRTHPSDIMCAFSAAMSILFYVTHDHCTLDSKYRKNFQNIPKIPTNPIEMFHFQYKTCISRGSIKIQHDSHIINKYLCMSIERLHQSVYGTS